MTDGEAGLGERVDRATESLDRVRDSIDREAEVREREVSTLARKQETAARARRRSNAALALAVALLAVGLFAKFRQDQADERERVRQAVVACNNANLSRQAIQDEFDVFITLLGAAGAPPASAEAAAARQQTIDKFRQDFRNNTPQALKQRDCSERAVMSPTPLTTSPPIGG